MKIRKASIIDKKTIFDIEWKSDYRWNDNKKEVMEMVEDNLKSKDDSYILEVSNKPIGYFTIGYRKNVSYVHFLAIIKSYKRKGLAKKLLKKAFALSRNKGCKKIVVQCWAKNFPVIILNTKLGFYVSDIKHNFYPNKDSKLKMEKIVK